jgi:hypothetical protein
LDFRVQQVVLGTSNMDVNVEEIHADARLRAERLERLRDGGPAFHTGEEVEHA